MQYRFGVFEFDAATGELRKSGRAVALEPQPAKALALLLLRADAVVSREELRDAVWGRDTHVDFDRGLAYCVSQIRASLGDSGENPRFLQTIPKRGFKFIAPVHTAVAPPADGDRVGRGYWAAGRMVAAAAVMVGLFWAVASRERAEAARVVIAVSVFDNETGDEVFDRPIAGLSDLVTEHLTKVDSRLAIVGNAAVLRQPRNIRNLKAVPAGVDADYVLLGQLQKGEAGLRFITHLIRLQDDAHLKANRLSVTPDLRGLESAVVQEFDRAVREHILDRVRK